MGLFSKGKQESKKALPPRRRKVGNSGTQRYNNNLPGFLLDLSLRV